MTALVVVRPGFQDLLVDGSPRRALRFGLVEGGPLDPPALGLANRLVGNPQAACGVECVGRGPVLRAVGGPVRVALAGPLRLAVDGRDQLDRRSIVVPEAATCSVAAAPPGLRAWLAVAGGLAVPTVLGSRGVDRPGRLPGLAGRALAAGDVLEVGRELAGRDAAGPGPFLPRPPPDPGPWRLAVLRGPQWAQVGPAVRRHLLAHPYTVSPDADRAGLRLLGPPVPPAPAGPQAGRMLSEGTACGAVQLTPEGLPIVLLADRGSLGGYAKPLQLTTADTWRLAQARPGTVVRFHLTTLPAAWRSLRRAWLAAG